MKDNIFDAYSLKARFYPVVILFLPILIIGIIYSVHFDSVKQVATSAVIVSALTYLCSQLGRDRGKKKEPALWTGWGGSPSIQLLRLNNTIIDPHTKRRYHERLQQLSPVPTPPDAVMEASSPAQADQIYQAWTKFLISKTRDEKKYSLLLKENTSYGFRRNLWGLKSIAVTLLVSLLILNLGYCVYKNGAFNFLDVQNDFYYATIFLVAVILLWVFVFTKKWVKVPAFSYAERLCETVESIS